MQKLTVDPASTTHHWLKSLRFHTHAVNVYGIKCFSYRASQLTNSGCWGFKRSRSRRAGRSGGGSYRRKRCNESKSKLPLDTTVNQNMTLVTNKKRNLKDLYKGLRPTRLSYYSGTYIVPSTIPGTDWTESGTKDEPPPKFTPPAVSMGAPMAATAAGCGAATAVAGTA